MRNGMADGAVRLHRPEQPNGVGLVLTHGSGSNADAPLLVTLAEAFCAAGITVARYTMPFRQKRFGGPPSPAMQAADRAGLLEQATIMRGLVAGPVFLGGHSYGGRQSSILLAENPQAADRLLCLSYPLHPPKRPDQLRTAHFPTLRTPTLFVSGTKDEFGSPAEFERELPAIPAPVRTHWLPGVGHDLKKGRFDLTPILEFLSESP